MTLAWWQRGIIYQIYPRSFLDSNGDGVGDLPGIISRLDYLMARASMRSGSRRSILRRWPISATMSATTAASTRCFGTLADFDVLLAEAHARGLKVILDFVPNHTSDQHPWFIESRRRRATTRSATGISGATRPPTAARRTTGSATSAAAPGSWMSHAASITTTPS